MIFHQTLVVAVIFAALIFTPVESRDSRSCSQFCGASRAPVPYPFGFSGGCKIRLSCSEAGEVKIGEFTVQNFTSGQILLNFPAKCNRPIGAIRQLIGQNYEPTWRNSLLLQNCSAPINDCVIPTSMLENRFEALGCGASSRNDRVINCYSQEYGGVEAMNYGNLTLDICQGLFSSIALVLDSNSSRNSDVSLDFQTMELGWWLNEHCNCAENANCTTVPLSNGTNGTRCQCLEGFVGDGFHDGNGCRREIDNLEPCGLPLPNMCPGEGRARGQDSESDKDEDKLITLWFMILGFAFEFWGVFGSILLKTSWGDAYFKLLNDAKDWAYVIAKVNMARILNKLKG